MTIKNALKELGATKRKIAENIYYFAFNDRRNMCKVLLRFEEYYESPKFKGKVFKVKEFKEWYKTRKNGKFTYYSDWSGFNIPSYAFEPFKNKEFNPLTKKEKLFLKTIKNIKHPYYIIATPKTDRCVQSFH